MKRSVRLGIATAVASVVLSVTGASAFAANTGYEGQPGNQSSNQGNNNGNGPTGYEGQPGNQG
jgi:hypothetical protein